MKERVNVWLFLQEGLQAIEQVMVSAVGALGSTVTTDQIAKRLAAESTVSPADVKAVLEALSGVMGGYMAQGCSVKLDGIGSFFFQSSAAGNGVKKAEDVSANMIKGVKVRFIPETTYKRGGGSSMKGRKAICALTDVEWIDVAMLASS